MSDQEDFDQEITPFQEYTIAFAVILIFGAMYLFFMKGCQPTASLITQAVSPPPAQVISGQPQSQHFGGKGIVTDAEQEKGLEVSDKNLGVNESRAEIQEISDSLNSGASAQHSAVDVQAGANVQADNAARIKAEAANLAAATAARKLADEKHFQEKQAALESASVKLATAEKPQQKATVIPEESQQKSTDTIKPLEKAEVETGSSSVPEPASNFNLADELARVDFTLPDGRVVKIPDNGFESRFKQSVLQESAAQTIVFDRISFFSGSDLLNPDSSDQILGVAAIMNAYKDIGIKLRGHTDSAGATDKNLILSFKRSKNLRDQLVGLGIDSKRIQVEGLGSTEPVSDNGSEKGRNKNRRIDLTVIR